MHLVGRRTVEFEIARQRHDIGPRLRQWLADIARLGLGEEIDIREHAGRDPAQDAPAFRRGQPAPFAGERLSRGRDRQIDILAPAARELREHLPGRGVADVDLLTIHGVAPFIGDEIAIDFHVAPRSRPVVRRVPALCLPLPESGGLREHSFRPLPPDTPPRGNRRGGIDIPIAAGSRAAAGRRDR